MDQLRSPDDWIASLDAPMQEQARGLIERFKQLGAHDAERWAYSEMLEGIPQLARFLILRRLWREEIDYTAIAPNGSAAGFGRQSAIQTIPSQTPVSP